MSHCPYSGTSAPPDDRPQMQKQTSSGSGTSAASGSSDEDSENADGYDCADITMSCDILHTRNLLSANNALAEPSSGQSRRHSIRRSFADAGSVSANKRHRHRTEPELQLMMVQQHKQRSRTPPVIQTHHARQIRASPLTAPAASPCNGHLGSPQSASIIREVRPGFMSPLPSFGVAAPVQRHVTSPTFTGFKLE
jgi:hypothetical protein